MKLPLTVSEKVSASLNERPKNVLKQFTFRSSLAG